jgi:hypothetical protein
MSHANFSNTCTRNFTIFAPTDAAIQDAYESGALDYPEMFATRKPFLAGVVAYHTVAQVALTAPGAPTLTMSTMLTDQGKASCANPALSWRPDGFIYGGWSLMPVEGLGNASLFPQHLRAQ